MGFANKELKPLILKALGTFTLAGDRIGQIGWSQEQATFLKYCLDHIVISRSELEEEIAIRVKQLGRESYLEHINGHEKWPDHTISAHALAYAIREGELTSAEIQQIKFDHGDTPSSFMEAGVKNLIPRVAERLLPDPF